MRRIVTLLIAILLPLQWSVAAAGQMLVLSDPAGMAHAASEVHGSVHAHDEHHDRVGMHPEDDSAFALGEAPEGSRDIAAADAPVAGAPEADCSAGAHLHACCHVASVALPVVDALMLPPSAGVRPVPASLLPPHSRVPDGPFRPPRTVTA